MTYELEVGKDWINPKRVFGYYSVKQGKELESVGRR